MNCVQRSKEYPPIYTRRWWILLGGLFLLLIAQLAERGIVAIIILLYFSILPKSLVQFRLRRIWVFNPLWSDSSAGSQEVALLEDQPRWSDSSVGRALGCYYVVFRGRPWICVVVVTYPTHMFAAYTGKSWVQPPVGPPFFISFYDLKNDFYIFGRYIFGKYNGRSRRAVSQGYDSCDAKVSSATPSTYMVGPMFLVSLQHILFIAVCCEVTRRPVI